MLDISAQRLSEQHSNTVLNVRSLRVGMNRQYRRVQRGLPSCLGNKQKVGKVRFGVLVSLDTSVLELSQEGASLSVTNTKKGNVDKVMTDNNYLQCAIDLICFNHIFIRNTHFS